jgi:protein tyrosine phosphatase
LNQPRLILGKTENGTYSALLQIINLPWLSLTYFVWYLNVLVSTEDFENQIGNTNVYISRRPRLTELKEIYEVVIDLTAEFIEPKKEGQSYFHLPWLDGMSPSNFKIPEGITTNSKILIHCAQGHGRSATYTAMLLKQLKLCDSTAEAYHLILQSRPSAKVSKQQLQYLLAN